MNGLEESKGISGKEFKFKGKGWGEATVEKGKRWIEKVSRDIQGSDTFRNIEINSWS